jgi:hypothetical protein
MTLRLRNIVRVASVLACIALVIAGVDVLEDKDWRGFLLLAGALLVCVGAFTPGRLRSKDPSVAGSDS